MRAHTLVLRVGLVEALGVNEAESLSVGQEVQTGGAVGHQSVVPVTHPRVALQIGQLSKHLLLFSLQDI